jgi:hypothetical protein
VFSLDKNKADMSGLIAQVQLLPLQNNFEIQKRNFRSTSLHQIISEGIEEKNEDEFQFSENGQWYCCSTCNLKITPVSQAIKINNSHNHVFPNPAGLVFEIGCFLIAPGCHNSGSPTSECSWFGNYLWRFSGCSGCGSHLGWFYLNSGSSSGRSSFYGLILAHLRLKEIK